VELRLGGGAAQGDGGDVVREEVGLGLAFYRAEGGSGEDGRGGAGRSVAPAPLMAARCGRRVGEGAGTAVG
jgi:hypothetical protein